VQWPRALSRPFSRAAPRPQNPRARGAAHHRPGCPMASPWTVAPPPCTASTVRRSEAIKPRPSLSLHLTTQLPLHSISLTHSLTPKSAAALLWLPFDEEDLRRPWSPRGWPGWSSSPPMSPPLPHCPLHPPCFPRPNPTLCAAHCPGSPESIASRRAGSCCEEEPRREELPRTEETPPRPSLHSHVTPHPRPASAGALRCSQVSTGPPPSFFSLSRARAWRNEGDDSRSDHACMAFLGHVGMQPGPPGSPPLFPLFFFLSTWTPTWAGPTLPPRTAQNFPP
jgi:hypothetical protein